jgi:hypothetical protein
VPYHCGKIKSKKSIKLMRRARIARGGNQRRPKTSKEGNKNDRGWRMGKTGRKGTGMNDAKPKEERELEGKLPLV